MLVVLKLGSKVIETDESMRQIVDDVCRLMEERIKVVIISSGAIACARDKLSHVIEHSNDRNKQVLAAIGQAMLMARYSAEFVRYRPGVRNYYPAQVLLTSDDFRDERREVLCGVINQLISLRTVPIINENDVVTIEGVKDLESWEFNENDRLTRLVSCFLAADLTIFGTDVPGILNSQGELIPVLYSDDEVALGKGNPDSRGGPEAKIKEGFFLARFGKRAIIADPRWGNLYNLVRGRSQKCTVLRIR